MNRYISSSVVAILIFTAQLSNIAQGEPLTGYVIEQFYEKECSGQVQIHQQYQPLSEIILTPDGKTGTLIWGGAISCTTGPAQPPWCAISGQCAFHIVVDSQTYEGWGGQPFNVIVQGNVLIVIPKHGAYCETSEGEQGWGAAACYAVAIWNERSGTFLSKGNEIARK